MIVRLLTVLTVVTAGAVGGVMVATGAGPVAAAGDVVEGVSALTQSDAAESEGAPVDETESSNRTNERETAPFTFAIDRIESCGTTCRDVTSTLTNQQSTDATDVTVETEIYAGNGTDGDPIWTDTESVGTLAAGDSDTTTKQVDLSLTDAYAIEQNDGWITIETTITSDGETVTMTERRNAA